MQKNDVLWLGLADSYKVYNQLLATMLASGDSAFNKAEAENPLLEVVGNVGIITINGSLINGSSGWMLRYGVTGYDDIRAALVEALQHSEVGSILLNISSGGGAAEGPNDLAMLIRRIDKVKPVVTYTGSHMHSAALWVGASARRIFASETAQMGSLGTIIVHKDYSEAYKAENIKVTVVRAGAKKALVNGYEPLTKDAKTDLENKAQFMYDLFLASVSKDRNMNEDVADEKFGQGVELFASQAKEAGLIDEVGSYDDAFAYTQKLAEKRMDPNRQPQQGRTRYGTGVAANATNVSRVSTQAVLQQLVSDHNSPTFEGNTMPQPLSDAQIAAAAAGVILADAAAAAPTAPTAPAAGGAGAPAVQADAGAGAAPAAAAATPAAPAAQADAGLTAVLASLSASQAEVGRLTAEVATMKAAAEATVKHNEALVGIARAAVTSMGLHFGVSAESVAGMSAETVVSEYSRISALFKEKFKAGGVAATSATADEGEGNDKKAVPLSFRVATAK